MPNPLEFLEPGAVALLIAVLLGAVAALALGKLVPRSMYDKQEQRADKATQALADMSSALKSLTEEIRFSQQRRNPKNE